MSIVLGGVLLLGIYWPRRKNRKKKKYYVLPPFGEGLLQAPRKPDTRWSLTFSDAEGAEQKVTWPLPADLRATLTSLRFFGPGGWANTFGLGGTNMFAAWGGLTCLQFAGVLMPKTRVHDCLQSLTRRMPHLVYSMVFRPQLLVVSFSRGAHSLVA